MTAIGFDTLNATKRLRDAGMEERLAEAVVDLVQLTAHMPDISHLATKDDLRQMELATKADLRQLELATKSDLRQFEQSTKAELQEAKLTLRGELAQLEARLSEKIRSQGWAVLGGMAVLLAFYTAMAKLIA
jgi:hypothetical protein